MTSTAVALEIACAKPDCHWKGAPADAPGHPCPTPATDATMDEKAAAAAARGAKLPQTESPFLTDEQRAAAIAERDAEAAEPPNPFAGMLDVDGKPIADERADRTLPFWVVWHDDVGEVRVLGTRPSMEAAVELSQSVETTVGEVTIREQPTPPPPPPPSPAPPPPARESDEVETPIAADADPTDRDGLERWLLHHGAYDEQGVPQDEKTAILDARLSVLLEAAQADEEPDLNETIGEAVETPAAEEEPPPASPTPAPVEPEPELEPQPISAEADDGYVTVDVDERPWQLLAARQIQVGPSNLKWVIVDTTRGALIGRAKTKKAAHEARMTSPAGATAEVMRTDDFLQAAAEIEKRRELVEEPEHTTEQPAEDDDQPDQTAEDDDDGDTKPAGALFDANEYETEELQLAKVDGQTIDRIKIGFGGSIMLDRSDPADVALYRKLKLGEEVELRVSGRVSGTGAKGATNRDGDLDVVVGEKTIAVTTVYRLVAEELT